MLVSLLRRDDSAATAETLRSSDDMAVRTPLWFSADMLEWAACAWIDVCLNK